jgi:hypothetical protein
MVNVNSQNYLDKYSELLHTYDLNQPEKNWEFSLWEPPLSIHKTFMLANVHFLQTLQIVIKSTILTLL